ncbi:MAG: endopeptidase La, partial [Candidatus Rokubacteria bacterium]|nr:endopeptidase La [Candidatus Rokubacteria bacterium]
HAAGSEIDPKFWEKWDLHLHIPAGAIPKDGPSAGVTMLVALVSLLRDRPVKPAVAMTGEVTLSGRVLPVGGIKEKVLAAKRAGIQEVILPSRNEKALLEEVPSAIREEMTFHLVSTVEEVLDLTFPEASGAFLPEATLSGPESRREISPPLLG